MKLVTGAENGVSDPGDRSSTGPNTAPILVTRPAMPSFEEYVTEIASLWESRWLTNRGAKVVELERALCDYLGVPFGVTFTNGHSALETLLETYRVTGDVITTPFTFVSTTHAITRTGAAPVFCDIKEDDYTIDPTQIEALITPRTSAIVAVHVYGNLCDVDAIEDIASRHGLTVIYDAAHAFGVTRDGVGVGTFGDASMFSLHATKVFNSVEGGFAAVRNKAVAQELRERQNFGITGAETVDYVSGNTKMTEFAAAMGICNLRAVDDELARRAAIDRRYRHHLEGVPGLVLNTQQVGVAPNYAYFPVRIDPERFGADRDQVQSHLAARNIFSRKYFSPLISDFGPYKTQPDSSRTPVASRAAAEVLTLPLHSGLSDNDVDRVCSALLSAKEAT